ncbi:MAG: hypothetical protein ACQGVK_16820 [Myxococcota bacterium]
MASKRPLSDFASSARLALALLFALVFTGPLGACGSDLEERGMADFQEESTPESREAMAETEQDRDEEMARELSE